MNLLSLLLILTWSVFWLAYAIYILNSEKFYYRYKKLCTREDKPILFHFEFFISIGWSMSGYTALAFFLSGNI